MRCVNDLFLFFLFSFHFLVVFTSDTNKISSSVLTDDESDPSKFKSQNDTQIKWGKKSSILKRVWIYMCVRVRCALGFHQHCCDKR